MKTTPQQNFWASDFGDNYTNRNEYDPNSLDKFYKKTFGISRSEINTDFLQGLKIKDILEVGCNIGNQLGLLQKQGYKNLYGIEINEYAVAKAKQHTKNINIIKGSAFDLPFRGNYFDLVFTAGVLIHVSPKNIKQAIKEIYRVSKKYIWGYEYFNEEYETIEYRNNKDYLWKANFVQLYLDNFPDLKLVKVKKYKYLNNENVDTVFLLEKKS
ncbi:methyltransferase domain-containing protein [bacterium]|nr:methyltransferase domain-containing protein [bacterium]